MREIRETYAINRDQRSFFGEAVLISAEIPAITKKVNEFAAEAERENPELYQANPNSRFKLRADISKAMAHYMDVSFRCASTTEAVGSYMRRVDETLGKIGYSEIKSMLEKKDQ